MLQRAHVLASQAVVGRPFLLVVVFGPGDVSHMADVHVHPGEGHFSDHAPAVDGVCHRVEQAVGQAGVLHNACLVLGDAVVAFCGCKPAPDHGREQVAADLLAGEVLHVVGLKLGFGVLQSGLEGVELFGADAACADADDGGLACHVALVRGQVPLRGVVQLGEAALALQVGAHGDGGVALGYDLAVQGACFSSMMYPSRLVGSSLGCMGLLLAWGLGQVLATRSVEAWSAGRR